MLIKVKDKRLPSKKTTVKQNKIVSIRTKYRLYKKLFIFSSLFNIILLFILYKLTTI